MNTKKLVANRNRSILLYSGGKADLWSSLPEYEDCVFRVYVFVRIIPGHPNIGSNGSGGCLAGSRH